MKTYASVLSVRRFRSRGRNAVLLVLFLLGPFLGREVHGQDLLEQYEYRQPHMGMAVRIVLYAPHDTTARRAASAAFQRIEALEQIMSSYRPESELNRLSEQAGGPPVPVSDPLFDVLRQAQTLARQSEGAFDVTAGPSLALWEEARRTGELPDSSALREASARVDWKKLRLNADRETARLKGDSMRLNLGGIAKGFILDRALDTLSATGISRAMIEAGGDLVAGDPPPNREGWRVRLPSAGPNGKDRTLRLSNAAVATSGDTQQFVEIDGTRYSHVVDPRTGLGVTHRLLVTVIADDGATADGLATTVGVLGAEEGRTFLDTHFPSVRAYIRSATTLSAN